MSWPPHTAAGNMPGPSNMQSSMDYNLNINPPHMPGPSNMQSGMGNPYNLNITPPHMLGSSNMQSGMGNPYNLNITPPHMPGPSYMQSGMGNPYNLNITPPHMLGDIENQYNYTTRDRGIQMPGLSNVPGGMGYPYTTPINMHVPGLSNVPGGMSFPYTTPPNMQIPGGMGFPYTIPPDMQMPGLSNAPGGMRFPYTIPPNYMQMPGWLYEESGMRISPPDMGLFGGLGDWRVKPGYEEFCEAILNDNWEEASEHLRDHPEYKTAKISQGDDTALHIAVAAGLSSFAEKLVNLLEPEDLEIKNKDGNTAFCLVAASGNVELAEIMRKKKQDLHTISGKDGSLPIDMAGRSGQSKMVEYLYQLQMEVNSEASIKSFFSLIQTGLYDEALHLLEEHPDLATARVKPEETARAEPTKEKAPDHRAETNDREIKTRPHEESNEEKAPDHRAETYDQEIKAPPHEESNEEKAPDHRAETNDQEIKAPPHEELNEEKAPNTAVAGEEAKERTVTALHILLRKLIMSSKIDNQDQPGLSKGFFKALSGINKFGHIKLPPKGLLLVENIWRIIKQSKEGSSEIIEELVPLLFVAAAQGHVEILNKFIPGYHSLMMRVDNEGRNLFDVAIWYRQKDILTLLGSIPLSLKEKTLQHKDNNGNNILHFAAMLPPPDRLNTAPDAALQLQQDILWFKKVRKLVDQSIAVAKNKEGKTPRDIFAEQHEKLKEKREEWMRNTANSCMIVATLIATVVFAAAFTIPGGTKEQTGTPYVIRKTSFIIFVISDAMSLVSSACSIITFLSILTSQYEDDEFISELPRKLILGLATLLLSIAGMMIVFGATIFIVFKDGVLWVPILVSTIAFVPVLLFLVQHLRLFITVLGLTSRNDSLLQIVESSRRARSLESLP